MYAVGDVRSNSVKRIASAVGEGSVVISDVHRYLADRRHNAAIQSCSALPPFLDDVAKQNGLWGSVKQLFRGKLES
jgi:hypothetical protein